MLDWVFLPTLLFLIFNWSLLNGHSHLKILHWHVRLFLLNLHSHLKILHWYAFSTQSAWSSKDIRLACAPLQPILLSLIQQLSVDLANETPLKTAVMAVRSHQLFFRFGLTHSLLCSYIRSRSKLFSVLASPIPSFALVNGVFPFCPTHSLLRSCPFFLTPSLLRSYIRSRSSRRKFTQTYVYWLRWLISSALQRTNHPSTTFFPECLLRRFLLRCRAVRLNYGANTSHSRMSCRSHCIMLTPRTPSRASTYLASCRRYASLSSFMLV